MPNNPLINYVNMPFKWLERSDLYSSQVSGSGRYAKTNYYLNTPNFLFKLDATKKQHNLSQVKGNYNISSQLMYLALLSKDNFEIFKQDDKLIFDPKKDYKIPSAFTTWFYLNKTNMQYLEWNYNFFNFTAINSKKILGYTLPYDYALCELYEMGLDIDTYANSKYPKEYIELFKKLYVKDDDTKPVNDGTYHVIPFEDPSENKITIWYCTNPNVPYPSYFIQGLNNQFDQLWCFIYSYFNSYAFTCLNNWIKLREKYLYDFTLNPPIFKDAATQSFIQDKQNNYKFNPNNLKYDIPTYRKAINIELEKEYKRRSQILDILKENQIEITTLQKVRTEQIIVPKVSTGNIPIVQENPILFTDLANPNLKAIKDIHFSSSRVRYIWYKDKLLYRNNNFEMDFKDLNKETFNNYELKNKKISRIYLLWSSYNNTTSGIMNLHLKFNNTWLQANKNISMKLLHPNNPNKYYGIGYFNSSQNGVDGIRLSSFSINNFENRDYNPHFGNGRLCDDFRTQNFHSVLSNCIPTEESGKVYSNFLRKSCFLTNWFQGGKINVPVETKFDNIYKQIYTLFLMRVEPIDKDGNVLAYFPDIQGIAYTGMGISETGKFLGTGTENEIPDENCYTYYNIDSYYKTWNNSPNALQYTIQASNIMYEFDDGTFYIGNYLINTKDRFDKWLLHKQKYFNYNNNFESKNGWIREKEKDKLVAFTKSFGFHVGLINNQEIQANMEFQTTLGTSEDIFDINH